MEFHYLVKKYYKHKILMVYMYKKSLTFLKVNFPKNNLLIEEYINHK